MMHKYTFYRDQLDSLRIQLPERIDMFSDFIGQIATEERANQFIQIIDEVKRGYMRSMKYFTMPQLC